MRVESWNVRIEHAYASTLNAIGHISNDLVLRQDATSDNNCRRITLFPHFLDEHFIDLVEAQQPRALVILGHHFALLRRYDYLWWIGSMRQDELEGLTAVLPEEWKQALRVSLSEMLGCLHDAEGTRG